MTPILDIALLVACAAYTVWLSREELPPRSVRANIAIALLFVALIAACTASAATPTRPRDAVLRSARASFYGEAYRGRPMAWKGLPFDPDALTCASWFYPFGTVLEVRSGARTVRVTVTDRGPAWELVHQGIVLDLSEHAFALLSPDRRHPLRPGPIPISLRVVGSP